MQIIPLKKIDALLGESPVRFFFLFLILVNLLAGCATRASISPEEQAKENALRAFSEELSSLPTGASQFFPNSPYGPANIEAGGFYISGLGNECRSARILHGAGSYRFALCKGKDDQWLPIPTIFERLN